VSAREAFETWAEGRVSSLHMRMGVYYVADAQRAWEAWQAASAGKAELLEAARVLAEFAKTAPGRLPQRVQDAIAKAGGAS
jgi:hypothetical protein